MILNSSTGNGPKSTLPCMPQDSSLVENCVGRIMLMGRLKESRNEGFFLVLMDPREGPHLFEGTWKKRVWYRDRRSEQRGF